MRVILTVAVIVLLLLLVRCWPQRGVRIGLLLTYVVAVLIITLETRNYDNETHVVLNPFGGYQIMLRSWFMGWKSGGWHELWKRIGWYKGQMSSMTLNVMLFVPLGFLAPSIVTFFRRWWKILLLGLCVSLLVETTQLITHLGWFDTSDLLHNTLGTLIGCWLYRKVYMKEGI